MANIAQIMGRSSDKKPSPNSDLTVSPDKVGIEVEVEGFPAKYYQNKELKWWYAERDGSLRNDGIEFILRHPTGGADLIKALEEFSNLTKNRKVDMNDRTSVHVHVDVRNMTPKKLKTFLLLSIMFEEVFMKKTGNRQNNIFCCKFCTSDIQLKAVSDVGYLSRENVGNFFHATEKYASVNMLCMADKGSIEFRYHKGTIDTGEMLDWVNTLLSLKKYAMESEFNPEELTGMYSAGGGMQMFKDVLGEKLASKYSDDETNEDLKRGMRLAQDAILLGNLHKKQEDIFYKINKDNFLNPLIKNFGKVKKTIKKKMGRECVRLNQEQVDRIIGQQEDRVQRAPRGVENFIIDDH